MVHYVSELHRQRYAHTFSELNLFRQSSVKVPLSHAAQVVDAAAACIVTQNAAAEVIVQRRWISQHVQTEWTDSSDAV